jgi:hypothetical protein
MTSPQKQAAAVVTTAASATTSIAHQNNRHLIPYDQLEDLEQIGVGSFGIVYKADVCIMQLHERISAVQEVDCSHC